MFCFLDLFVTGITKHLLVESNYFISNLNSPRTPANCISISRPPQNACSKSSSRLRSQSKFQALQVLSRGWKLGSTPSGRGLGRACSSPTSAILPSPTEHPAAADLAPRLTSQQALPSLPPPSCIPGSCSHQSADLFPRDADSLTLLPQSSAGPGVVVTVSPCS